MIIQNLVPEKTLEWPLDPRDPGARYLSLKNLSNLSDNDPELITACEIAHQKGPIKIVLDAMHLDGYWVEDGPGYSPKYRSAAWSLILLAQLGASAEFDSRIHKACQRYLASTLSKNGQISSTGPPSGTIDCLQGNILVSLLGLGYLDPRLDKAFE